MNDTRTTAHPEALNVFFDRLGLAEMLTGCVDRSRVHAHINVATLEVAVQSYGYQLTREDSNIYGRLHLEPVPTVAAPVLRIVTRSDHAAVHGSRRAA